MHWAIQNRRTIMNEEEYAIYLEEIAAGTIPGRDLMMALKVEKEETE